MRPDSRNRSDLFDRVVLALLGLGVLGGFVHRGFLGGAGLGVLGGRQRAAVGGRGQKGGGKAEGEQGAFHLLSPGY